ncbi:MAG: SpoIIIAH-like family protein [Clostridia bacterium]|nr:SpoIIIAH-like family protein [Clostridia bacterium]
MKVTYIKLFKKKNEKVLMKHLRDKENQSDFNIKKLSYSITNQIKNNVKKLFDKNGVSRKIVRKNQVVLVATALMLVTAGYLNYTNNIKMSALGDAQLVNTNITINEENKLVNNLPVEDEVIETSITNEKINLPESEIIEDNTKENTQKEENSDTIPTITKTNENEYFTKTKLEREKMYSQMLETYQKIIENPNIPNDQKSIASNEIKNINSKKGAIATIENLMKAKGFEDVAVLVNDNSINIVVKSSNNLETTQVAQIQNIVSREFQSDIEDIHITTHD